MKIINKFQNLESSGGIALLMAALVAIIVSNSPLSSYYDAFLVFSLGFKFGDYTITAPLTFWISEGLMTLFFLLIGIEVKKELFSGELSSRAKAMLPVGAALGGIAVPAIIYALFNRGTSSVSGWAIPTATDIAFSLAVLSLFGKKLHPWLKLFLMSIAIIDDVVAVAIIALFYNSHIFVWPFYVALLSLVALVVMNRRGVQNARYFAVLGTLFWAATLASGIHATIAGVILGFLLPSRAPAGQKPLADRTLGALANSVTFGILPLFAFANSGISFAGILVEHLTNAIPLGIALGLCIGKPAGIVLAVWLLIRFGRAKRPEGVDTLELLGVCALAGIGFTMSLFIGTLAFSNVGLQFYTRLGVLMGSVVSALAGYVILTLAVRRKIS